MSPWSARARWVVPVLHRIRPPLAVLALYTIASPLFTLVAGHDGLLTPFGAFHLGTMLLGVLTLVLRLAVLFLVLPWTVFRAFKPA